MKRKSLYLLFFVLLAFILLPIYSEAVKIVSWNALNFPGSTGAAREAYFRTVINKLNPDVLVVQEMLSQTGVNQFLSRVMNYTYPGRYAVAGFTDGPDTDNAMFYKKSTISYLARKQIATTLRDISVYRVKIISGLGLNSEFSICSVHFKSGTSSSDKVQRGYEANLLRNYLNSLSSTSVFLVCGDFNSYTSSDPSFVELNESRTDNDGRCKDPINKLGSWHDNFTFAKYHSQSSRATAFGGGASGGMDDRFDLILVPYTNRKNLVYKSGSYNAYGNDGLHFNKSVNSGTNSSVETVIANALYQASDHLPVVIELVPPGQVLLNEPSNLAATKASLSQVNLSWSDNSTNETGFKIERKTASTWTQIATVGTNIKAYQNKNLVSNTTYYYRVRAYNAGGYSAYSNTASITLGSSPRVSITSFYLTPEAGTTGKGTMTWATQNATSVTISPSIGSPGINGSAPFQVNKTTTWTLTAYGNSGPVTRKATYTFKSAITVYITETGSKYHRDGCQYLSSSKIAITLSEACAKGFTPCSVCDPPPCSSAAEAVPVGFEDIAPE